MVAFLLELIFPPFISILPVLLYTPYPSECKIPLFIFKNVLSISITIAESTSLATLISSAIWT